MLTILFQSRPDSSAVWYFKRLIITNYKITVVFGGSCGKDKQNESDLNLMDMNIYRTKTAGQSNVNIFFQKKNLCKSQSNNSHQNATRFFMRHNVIYHNTVAKILHKHKIHHSHPTNVLTVSVHAVIVVLLLLLVVPHGVPPVYTAFIKASSSVPLVPPHTMPSAHCPAGSATAAEPHQQNRWRHERCRSPW